MGPSNTHTDGFSIYIGGIEEVMQGFYEFMYGKGGLLATANISQIINGHGLITRVAREYIGAYTKPRKGPQC